MVSLDTLQALGVGDQQVKLVRGVVVTTSGSSGYAVNVLGNVIPARAADPTPVVAGDTVLVAILAGATGQGEAIVLCRIGSALRPATGTVTTVPPSSSTITVTGADGVAYTAYFPSSYTPTVGDNVEIVFLAGFPYVTKTGATPAPAPVAVVAPPPTAPLTGTTPFAASDSSTWWGPGGWGSWNTYSQPSGVFQGDYGSGPLTGAFFYGGGPGQLAGRTILGGRVTFGPRLAVGSYNSPVTVTIYTHSSTNRPAGNVSLLNSTTVTAQPWQGLTTYALTAAQAADIVGGGGIAIANNGYAGFAGISVNAQSGTVSIDWSR